MLLDASVARSIAVLGWVHELAEAVGGSVRLAHGVLGADQEEPCELRRIRDALQREANTSHPGSGRYSKALTAVHGLDALLNFGPPRVTLLIPAADECTMTARLTCLEADEREWRRELGLRARRLDVGEAVSIGIAVKRGLEFASDDEQALIPLELPPRGVVARSGCGGNLQGLEDPADGGCAYPVAGFQQLALNPLVSPGVVLGGEPLDERCGLGADRRPSCPAGVGPLAGDQAAVPPQDGAGGDQPVHPQPCRQETDERGEDCAVGPVQPGPGIGAAQHGDLVPQHQQLGVLGSRAPAEQDQPAAQPDENEIEQAEGHGRSSCPTAAWPIAAAHMLGRLLAPHRVVNCGSTSRGSPEGCPSEARAPVSGCPATWAFGSLRCAPQKSHKYACRAAPTSFPRTRRHSAAHPGTPRHTPAHPGTHAKIETKTSPEQAKRRYRRLSAVPICGGQGQDRTADLPLFRLTALSAVQTCKNGRH